MIIKLVFLNKDVCYLMSTCKLIAYIFNICSIKLTLVNKIEKMFCIFYVNKGATISCLIHLSVLRDQSRESTFMPTKDTLNMHIIDKLEF